MSLLRITSSLFVTLCVCAGAGLPRGALAQQVVASDCNLDFTNVYNKGDAVCVTGDLDYVPPGKIFGEAYLYVIPVDHPNPFADVTGAPNYIIGNGGGGSFIDEFVWLPPLKSGQYEFVIDNHPFFIDDMENFDPGKDLRTGLAFTVSNAPIVFSVDTNMIKAAALLALDDANALMTLADALELIDEIKGKLEKKLKDEAKDMLLEALCEELELPCPQDYNSWVLSTGADIIRGIGESLEKKYLAIIADPPDPNFKAVVGLDFAELKGLSYPWTPVADRTVPARLHAMSQQLALQALAFQAMVPTMEKVQGATMVNDSLWAQLHAEKLRAYTNLALTAGDAAAAEADALEAALDAAQLELGPGIDAFNGFLADVTAGIDESDRDYLRSYGFSEADIDAGVAAVAARTPLVDAPNLKNLLARARGSVAKMKPALQDLDNQAENVRAETAENVVRPGPKLVPGAPPAATVGTAVMLSASAEHFDPDAALAYTWDLDLDGQFDDGAAASVMYTPTAPGAQIVAVRVFDGKSEDLGFIVVPVQVGNVPPEVTELTPLEKGPYADTGEKLALHIEATDKDGDPLTYTWTVDGQPAGMGQDLEFTMPDEQAHRVVVVVADDDPHSPDVTLTKVVRHSKWESMGGTSSDSDSDTSGDPTDSATDTSDPTEGTGGVSDSATGDVSEGPSSDSSEPTSAGPGGDPTEGGDPTAGTEGTEGTGTDSAGSTPGEGSGCGCRSDASPAGASLLALALLGLRRRRR